MSSITALRKAKLTITISCDIDKEINEITRQKKAPKSRIIEELLRDSLQTCKQRAIEKDIEAYYLSLTEKEKKEDREWTGIAEESAKKAWDD